MAVRISKIEMVREQGGWQTIVVAEEATLGGATQELAIVLRPDQARAVMDDGPEKVIAGAAEAMRSALKEAGDTVE